MKEFDIINQFFKVQGVPSANSLPVKNSALKDSVVKSIGDDCAILSVPDKHDLVVSMDTLVSGRHFPDDALPGQIATRAFGTCLSDLAAMGAIPCWFTLGLTMPEADIKWIAPFSESLLSIAQDYQCELIGGDTTQGPLTITLQVHGIVEQGKALRRDQASVGDYVFVTGYLGDGAAALALINDEAANNAIADADKKYLDSRFYCPQPQIQAALNIVDYSRCAIDISDGLLADLQHVATASQVDIEIDVDKLPISLACKHLVDSATSLSFALSGGDDYQVAFTVPENHLPDVMRLINDESIAATEIGRVVKACSANNDYGVRCFDNGKAVLADELLIHNKGYQHFTS